MVQLPLTAAAVAKAPAPAAVTGASDLLAAQGLSVLSGVAAKALHLDYSNPECVKSYDALGKIKGPPTCKQLYMEFLPRPAPGQPAPVSRWSLFAVASWPPHSYTFHPYSTDAVSRGLALQPGAYALSEPELGQPVGPMRGPMAAAAAAQALNAGLPDMLPQPDASQGRGRRAVGGKRRAGVLASTSEAGSASDTTMSTQDTVSSIKRSRMAG